MNQTEEELVIEAHYFHKAMYGFRPTKKFVDYYVAANRESEDLKAEADEVSLIRLLIRKNACPLSVESSLRKKSDRHLLTRKMILISFLAECDGNHIQNFDRPLGVVRFWLSFPYIMIRATMRKVRGKIFLVLHGI